MTHIASTPLSKAEIDELLARNWLGRLAFSWHDRVDIEPIGYAYDPPWIFGRTSVGTKLVVLAHNSTCAMEVDEVDGPLRWRSVVVKGPFSALNSTVGEDPLYPRALAALRRVLPTVFTDEDPAPERHIVFGIHASEISGRRMADETD